MKKILFIFGTRPEAIKMAPLIIKMKQAKVLKVEVCITGQHKEMLDQVLDFFHIVPDYNLNLMKLNQTLFDITADALRGLENILQKSRPDWIIVQGDTTTAFVGALAGYYNKIKVAHLEAGLRSSNKYSPFPEEINRCLISKLADLHLTPTAKAVENLKNEGIEENVHNVTNTVIDALLMGLEIIKKKGEKSLLNSFNYLDLNKKIILITAHRRESFGEPFIHLCNGIKQLAYKYPEVQFVYPVHFNPNVRKVVNEILINISNIFLIEPLEYQEMIWLMSKSYLILTDSGGVQEEAPTLGKPVLVLRDVTEREEGIEAQTAKLVGTETDNIISATSNLIDSKQSYNKMANAINPYGIGEASEKIIKIFMDMRD